MGTLLDVPYTSQKDVKTAGYSFNDCGPCCLAMMVLSLGQQITTDQIYKSANIANKGPLLVSTVRNAGNLYGLDLKVHDISSDASIDGLKKWLDGGRPALALIDYAPIMRAGYQESAIHGGHFVLVVGYDDDDVIVHDPYWNKQGGKNRYWRIPVFAESWYQKGTQYQRVALVPEKAIVKPLGPAFTVPTDMLNRIRARAMFEGTPTPKLNNADQYQEAVRWLSDWGKESKTYKVVDGDTLGLIASKFYGSAQYYMAIAAYNGMADGNQIKVGQELCIPMPSTASSSGVSPTHSYTNQEIINAFHDAFVERGLADQYWQCVEGAGIANIASNRSALYTGPEINALPNMTAELKQLVIKHLSN
jgi:nucleoid-associated protein YgaU